MNHRWIIHLLIGVLLAVPLGSISYRFLQLGYPVLPTVPGKAWRVFFEATVKGPPGETTSILVALPDDQASLRVTEEKVESGEFSLGLAPQSLGRLGIWWGQLGDQEAIISYQATLVPGRQAPSGTEPCTLGAYPYGTDPSEHFLARELVLRWKPLEPPQRLRALMEALKGHWGDPPPPPDHLEEWERVVARHGKVVGAILLLTTADLPATLVEGLELSSRLETSPRRWIKVWTGRTWESFDTQDMTLLPKKTGAIALAAEGKPVVEVHGGDLIRSYWTVARERLSGWRAHFERIGTSPHLLDRWSLFRLPGEFQETFRILLPVAVGALMICLLRNVVGFPTFGVFMPVLMALAFRNTGLLYGLCIFAGIILLGYVVRRFLENLRLLMVPRLSLMLTSVIGAFTCLALLGNHLGQRGLMAVGLLSFVILTMTIERFFVVSEETGSRAAARMAAGSAPVASITGAMGSSSVDLLRIPGAPAGGGSPPGACGAPYRLQALGAASVPRRGS